MTDGDYALVAVALILGGVGTMAIATARGAGWLVRLGLLLVALGACCAVALINQAGAMG